MNISVIFEDDDILVINKPAGMTVNKADTTRHEETVQDWAEKKIDFHKETSLEDASQISNSKDINESDFYSRGGVVHRLDKETSGVLILAKNPAAFANIQRQFKERLVEKSYIALAHGKVVPACGEISVPVGRLPWNRMQFGVVPGGRESVTLYKVIEYRRDSSGEKYSYLELHPKTGRTHQIRVHLKYLGHPIFADFLYAGRKIARADRKILGRVFLHAAQIAFSHPKTGEVVKFESPLPKELTETLKQLEKIGE